MHHPYGPEVTQMISDMMDNEMLDKVEKHYYIPFSLSIFLLSYIEFNFQIQDKKWGYTKYIIYLGLEVNLLGWKLFCLKKELQR